MAAPRDTLTEDIMTKKGSPPPAQVNRGNQLNPSHDAYWQSRGQPGRPAGAPDAGPAADGNAAVAPAPATPAAPGKD